MTREDKNIITAIWNDMVLRNRLENDPYNLSADELTALAANDELTAKLKPVLTETYLKRVQKA